MKKILLILIITLNLCLLIPMSTLAKNVVLYRSNEHPAVILTKLGTTTTVKFVSELEDVISPALGFAIDFVKKNDKLTVTPKKSNAQTNLTVITSDGLVYTFRLSVVGDNEPEFYDFVEMRPAAEISIKDLINVTNKKLVEIDPALRGSIDVFEVYDNSQMVSNSKLKVYLKRIVAASLISKTAIWLRFENTNTPTEPDSKTIRKEKSKVLGPNDFSLPANKFRVADQEVYAICIEELKESIRPGEFVDVYLILEGGGQPKTGYAITLNLNGQDQSFTIGNIPYRKQAFKVFVANGNGYESVTIDDYWRQQP